MMSRVRKRRRAEKRFRRAGIVAVSLAIASLAVLLGSILVSGPQAFLTTQVKLDVEFDPAYFGEVLEATGRDRDRALARANYILLVRDSLAELFPEVTERRDIRNLMALVSSGARSELREILTSDIEAMGTRRELWVPADDNVDRLRKGDFSASTPESERPLSDLQLAWIERLESDGRLRTSFSFPFLFSGASRDPELAGIGGALVGSLLTLLVTLAIVFPLGVSTAVYLEEFAPKNRFTDIIEVNINNLAAVPSIVFGLLGLAMFLNFLHLSRSAPLVGGMTLALMTLPTIIITSRVAIEAVPPSIREAARGLGASPLQVVIHHVLPLAMPGVLTGTIIGMARALGETAPLLMIGMVAFIVDIPAGFNDASTVLPVQIFLWADSPERAFVEKTAGAILVLLAFLIAMNGAAIWLRRRFEKSW